MDRRILIIEVTRQLAVVVVLQARDTGNRAVFIHGREEIVAFLKSPWS